MRKTIELMMRRLYRILSHTYFHHKDVWTQFEERTSITKRYTQYAIKYALMPDDLLIIPRDVVWPEQEVEENMD